MIDLKLKFDPRTIEHLGIKMYSKLPAALAELVANSFDACASSVTIELIDQDSEYKVAISDDGEGMSFDQINDEFLVIGRKRRESTQNNRLGRKVTGRKGLGKLALFGIGKKIEIITARMDSDEEIQFILDWDEILKTNDGEYKPTYSISPKSRIVGSGTIIQVSSLKRSFSFDVEHVVVSLSKLFNFFDDSFKVYVQHNNLTSTLISREHRIIGIDKQFEWDVNTILRTKYKDYEYINEINGTIVSSSKPLKSDQRGVTLYSRGRQANEPSFFGLSEAGHSFSYLTGWIDADFLDEQLDDFISTDRQLVIWESDLTNELKGMLQFALRFVVQDWSRKRSQSKKNDTLASVQINVDDWISKVSEDMKPKLTNVVETIINQPELDSDFVNNLIFDMNQLIPEYTFYHYRHLNTQIRQVTKEKYECGDYYQAFVEAMKRYKNIVKTMSGTPKELDSDIVADAFGENSLYRLSVSKGFLRDNGESFSTLTLKNIDEAQKLLSLGVVRGGRNVVSHEEIIDLKNSGLFSESDCLDLLSLLSHLLNRIYRSSEQEL